MIELLNNPVTIIASIFAVFFLVMGLTRRVARHQHLRSRQPAEEPIVTVDPFTPVADDDPAHRLTTAETTHSMLSRSATARRYFKQYGDPANDVATTLAEDAAGYVWE